MARRTTTDRVRAITDRLRMSLQRYNRVWELGDRAAGYRAEFTNLGRVAAFILDSGGSATVALEPDEERELQQVALRLGVPFRQ